MHTFINRHQKYRVYEPLNINTLESNQVFGGGQPAKGSDYRRETGGAWFMQR